MKLIFLLLISSTLHAQRFSAKPVITEPVDTVAYSEVHNGKIYSTMIYKYKDGSGRVCIKNYFYTEFMSKRNYRKWKRKNVKL